VWSWLQLVFIGCCFLQAKDAVHMLLEPKKKARLEAEAAEKLAQEGEESEEAREARELARSDADWVVIEAHEMKEIVDEAHGDGAEGMDPMYHIISAYEKSKDSRKDDTR
jgi:hypothetical protein